MTAGAKPIAWMHALRDDPEVVKSGWGVLAALGSRMRPDGTGFASHPQIADDTGYNEGTVRRWTTWARRSGWLYMTRRGHRTTEGRSVASEWRLAIPHVQPRTRARLDPKPTAQNGAANRANVPSQPRMGARPRELHPENLSPEGDESLPADRRASAPSDDGRDPDLEAIASALDGSEPTEFELRQIRNDLDNNGIMSIPGFARASLNETLKSLDQLVALDSWAFTRELRARKLPLDNLEIGILVGIQEVPYAHRSILDAVEHSIHSIQLRNMGES